MLAALTAGTMFPKNAQRSASAPHPLQLYTRSSPAEDSQLLKRYQKAFKQSEAHAKERNKDKLVSLMEEGQFAYEDDDATPGGSAGLEVGAAEPAAEHPTTTGRIAIYCTASSYDTKGLREHLVAGGYACEEHPEVMHSRYVRRDGQATGDCLFFEYGVAVFWDLSPRQEQSLLQVLRQFEEGPLTLARVESDTFAFKYLQYSKPFIQNDVITMSPNLRDAHLTKISISFALSQSTKLSALEERVSRIVGMTRSLPRALAAEGKVQVSDTDIAKLLGRVFIEQTQLNLLGSVLDTPEFFWQAPDSMQSVYDKVWEYLEMADRIEVINTRLSVLHEMLDMLRSQQNALHSERVELIIIWLIVADCIILLFQLSASLGWVGKGGGGGGGKGPGDLLAALGLPGWGW